MEGIQQLFHELMGYDEYQQDLFAWVMRKREAMRATQERYEAKPRAIEMRRARQRAYWKRKHPPKPRRIVRPVAVREAHRIKMAQRRAEARAA